MFDSGEIPKINVDGNVAQFAQHFNISGNEINLLNDTFTKY